jgi:hypothetical protein
VLCSWIRGDRRGGPERQRPPSGRSARIAGAEPISAWRDEAGALGTSLKVLSVVEDQMATAPIEQLG